MRESVHFGLIVLVVAGALYVALLTGEISSRLRVPGPAFFLIGAAIASGLFSGVQHALSIRDVERIAVVALIVILFDGGMQVGATRFRAAALPIVSLGVVGTFATAAVVALAARTLFGFGWTTAGLIGAALAPTDPAVMFSVLGNREIGGRTGTILEGESGANDPVGIALMIGLLRLATHPGSAFWIVVREFVLQMAIGLAIGVAGGVLLVALMRRIRLRREALYPLRTLMAAGTLYGVASVAHGSGFLAVFVAGILAGDAEVPHKRTILSFHTSLASLAEIVVFIALGLTVHVGDLGHAHVWVEAVVLALVLALAARPLIVGPLLLPARLRAGERLFVMWGGLKGAVPILLAAFALLDGVPHARRIYDIVFIVVAFSVLVQGTSISSAAKRLGVEME